jgi:hypothetical protein
MEYRSQGVEVESEDDEDLVNGEAYEMEGMEEGEGYEMEGIEEVGLVKDEEQGGVVHLVHGWIQQNQPNKVSDFGD